VKNTSHLSSVYREKFALVADLYHLTMAYGFWKNDMQDRPSVFQLYFRRNPFGNPYAIATGLGLVVDYLQQFRFSVEDIHYLGSLTGADGLPLFEIGFLNYLQRLEFKCDVYAVPEGTAVFPNQPLIRVEGPLLQAQIIESALLNLVNFSTLIATKAARVVQAAQGDQILEFGLRRAQGLDGAITASRAAYIGGCDATSNLIAGKYYHIPVKGTHAHSWVMSYGNEADAYRGFANAMPNNCIFLVDTYDTINGIKNAIEIGKELRENGHSLLGIRLDSGDLSVLSKTARKMLDEAGMTETAIVASDCLDENSISKLKKDNAPINIWGVGTELITGGTQAALGGVYKLAAIQDSKGTWEYRIKKSEDLYKMSNPGIHQVRRYFDSAGVPQADVLFEVSHLEPAKELIEMANGTVHPLPSSMNFEDLLIPVFKHGKLIYAQPDVHQVRERSLQQQAIMQHAKAHFVHGLDRYLYDLKQDFAQKS
jgi:nicotinate phosphoribosyltransferase